MAAKRSASSCRPEDTDYTITMRSKYYVQEEGSCGGSQELRKVPESFLSDNGTCPLFLKRVWGRIYTVALPGIIDAAYSAAVPGEARGKEIFNTVHYYNPMGVEYWPCLAFPILSYSPSGPAVPWWISAYPSSHPKGKWCRSSACWQISQNACQHWNARYYFHIETYKGTGYPDIISGPWVLTWPLGWCVFDGTELPKGSWKWYSDGSEWWTCHRTRCLLLLFQYLQRHEREVNSN